MNSGNRRVALKARYLAFSVLMFAGLGRSAEAPVRPLTYGELDAMAMVMDATTDGGRYNDQLIQGWAADGLKGALRKCLGANHDDDTTEFTVLALVSGDGRPTNVRVSPQNELTTCFTHSLEQATLPSWGGTKPFPLAIKFNPGSVEASSPFRTSGPLVAPPPPPLPGARTFPALLKGDFTGYPLQSLAAGNQGAAIVMALISKKGAVVEARIDKSAGAPEMDAAALDFVRHATFRPGTIQDEPMPMYVRVPVNFNGEITDEQRVQAGNYVEQLDYHILAHWHARNGIRGSQCVLKISLQDDGTIADIATVEPCQFAPPDKSMLIKAVMGAGPLPTAGNKAVHRSQLFFDVVAR